MREANLKIEHSIGYCRISASFCILLYLILFFYSNLSMYRVAQGGISINDVGIAFTKVSSKSRLLSHDEGNHYHSISDSEAGASYGRSYSGMSSSLPNHNTAYMDRLYSDTEQTDDEEGRAMDEFGDLAISTREKSLRTGRQRKKLAARSKGGEFQARRKKRRVYFCCISSDIDVQKLFDYLVTSDTMSDLGRLSSNGNSSGPNSNRWNYQLYPGGDVLHLYKKGVDLFMDGNNMAGTPEFQNKYSNDKALSTNFERRASLDSDHGHGDGELPETKDASSQPLGKSGRKENNFRISSAGAQEVFIFDFGAAVFWGFSKGEEITLLKTIRLFVTKGLVGQDEFASGEDDMAFTTSPDLEFAEQGSKFTLTNDFITLPDDSNVKERLSISFAIGQSSVLAIFEARIERKVEEYKYIPETLAACGKVHLSEQQLGIMIGEVFVIRHDVNLHTEILDTPTFFWKEDIMEQDYKMVMDYLEMPGRTEILNKRLDMLRELLDVLQQQMESHHAMNLEWIVIWLIVVEVVLQLVAIGTDSMGTYFASHRSST